MVLEIMYHQKTDSQEYLPYIDGLRALAVLAVIAYHLNHQWLPGGFSGVDVFFVISGFVVSASMDRQGTASLLSFAIRFYSRRIRRIVPALMVCLLFFSLLSALFIPSSWLSDTNNQTGFYAFFGLSNLILAQTNNDYFSPRTDFNHYTHTWSLGVEEQFYFVFPLLFFLWVFEKRSDRKYLSTLVFFILTVLSLICAWWFSKRDAAFAYYMIFSRFWELAAGVILYQISSQFLGVLSSFGQHWRKTGATASLGLILAGFTFASPQNFPFPWALFPVLGTAGLLVFLRYNDKGFILNNLSNPYVIFIGRISYSLYLWHWPIIVLFRWTVGIDSAFEYIIVLLLTFLLATGSYYFVESPFRYAPTLRRLPNPSVVLIGSVAIIISYSVSHLISQHQRQLSLSVTKDSAMWYPDFFTPEFAKNNCSLNINYEMIQGGYLRLLSPNCELRNTKVRLFVVGDSHADAYFSMLQRFSMETGIEVLIYTKGGCSYLNLFHRHEKIPHCQQFSKAVTEDVRRRMQYGDILFLPSLRLVRFGDQWALFPEETVRSAMSGQEATEERVLAAEETMTILQPLVDHGVKVIFEAPKPVFRVPPFRCSDWFNKSNPICLPGFEMKKKDLLEYRQPVMESLYKISQKFQGIYIWDPFPVLCPDDTCKTSIDGKTLFFDGDHISGYGNMFLYDNFKRFVIEIINNPAAPAPPEKQEIP